MKRILGMHVKHTCNEGLWYRDAFLRLATDLASVSPIFTWSLWSNHHGLSSLETPGATASPSQATERLRLLITLTCCQLSHVTGCYVAFCQYILIVWLNSAWMQLQLPPVHHIYLRPVLTVTAPVLLRPSSLSFDRCITTPLCG